MIARWAERPIEEANLLNPAYCCVIITSSVVGYFDSADLGLPLPLAYVILPIILHKATRESLPRSTRTPMALWLQQNASARVLFSERISSLKPYTREAILFGCLNDWLSVEDDAGLRTSKTNSAVDRFARTMNGETRESVQRARLVGKWFALAGTPETVMALWGVRP